jgi:UDP-glucuronate 4-epimerase
VINLAAQAGVRYSLKNPNPYIKSNIQGFVNLLEVCKTNSIKHFIFASSSSIYGNTKKIKFSENDKAVSPLSLYASTKRCNEIIAHSYSHLYKMKITGLRFFSVYGPWGRPDMAYFKFVKNILNQKQIEIYNYGNHMRDFSYIDHIVEGIYAVSINKLRKNIKRKKYEIYNLANGKSKTLMSFLKIIEKCLNQRAKKKFIKLQDGDAERTYANVKKFILHYNLRSKVDLNTGISRFISWYKKFYKIK